MADFENEQQPAISSRQQAQAGVYGLPPTSRQGRAEETLMDAQGKTTISDGVVAKVAGIAASEIDGVHELVSPGAAGKAMSGLARVTGGDTRASGVRVEVGEREAAVDMNMVVDYGVSIPQIASAIRHNITNRVWEMTGLKVKEVNIGVTDIYFPQMEQSSQQARVQ